ncbi:MAG: hypothetical protein ABI768_10925 [Acidobacteriota bacterium]
MVENRGVDAELNYGGIFGFLIALLVLLTVAFLIVWGVFAWQKNRLVKQDAPPPVLAEARVKSLPAGVLLQGDPEKDLKILRAREDAVLSSWAWADPAHTRARVPADRALEIVAAKGFPPRTAPPPAPAPEVKK